jgi:hypothetical protein
MKIISLLFVGILAIKFMFKIGFLSGYSTTHQLIELNDDILLALDKKQITSITFADISKNPVYVQH